MDEQILSPLPPEEGTHVITEARLKTAAAMTISGAKKADIIKSLGMSAYGVDKLFKDDKFKQYIAELGEDALVSAKASTKARIGKLADKAIKALEKNLDKHSLEAVKIVLRAMGIDQAKESDEKSGGFTLVLANQSKPEPKTIEVVNEDDSFN